MEVVDVAGFVLASGSNSDRKDENNCTFEKGAVCAPLD